jgi:hypothetical protein
MMKLFRCRYARYIGRFLCIGVSSNKGMQISRSILRHLPQHQSEASLWPLIKEAIAVNPRHVCVINDDDHCSYYPYIDRSYIITDTNTKLKDPRRFQECYNFIRTSLLHSNGPLFLSSHTPGAGTSAIPPLLPLQLPTPSHLLLTSCPPPAYTTLHHLKLIALTQQTMATGMI